MATEVLAVDGVGANDAWVVGGPYTKVAAVATPDDEDGTNINGTIGQIQDLTFANSAIGAGDIINSVAITVRTRGAAGVGTPGDCAQIEGANVGTSFATNNAIGYATVTETARVLAPDGGAWTLAKLNNLAARLRVNDDTAGVVTTLFATVNFTPTGHYRLPLLGVG